MKFYPLAIALSACAVSSSPAAPDLGAPRVFAPGVISSAAHESAPAFSPDGRTLTFGRSTPAAAFILVSTREGSGWTHPTIAPFSGAWLDMEPAMAPDGSYLIFASNRPAHPGGRPIDGMIAGVAQPGKGSNLWRVDHTPRGWSPPTRLPDVINASGSIYAPSIAADGTLYFMQPAKESGRFQIFSAKKTAEGYATPEALPFSDGSNTDVDPVVAPDQSFIVFGSSRHAKKDIDLFIAYRSGAEWSEPVYLGDEVNSRTSDAEPRLGADHHTLYFSSERLAPVASPIAPADRQKVLDDLTTWNNGLYNLWTVDLAPLLRARVEKKQGGE